MARFKIIKPIEKRCRLTLTQLTYLGIQDENDLKVMVIPTFPEGIKPQMSRFWKAMSKRKLFRLRRKHG